MSMSKITELKLPKVEILKIAATKGMPEVGASQGPTNCCSEVNNINQPQVEG